MRFHYAVVGAAVLANLTCALQVEGAEQDVVQITPNFAADQPLTIEVRNLSKLPVRLIRTTLEFAPASSVQPCFLRLSTPVLVGPAGMTSIKLAENGDVMGCVRRARGVTSLRLTRPFILLGRGLPPSELRRLVPSRVQLQPVAVTFNYEIGSHPATSSMTWHFPVE